MLYIHTMYSKDILTIVSLQKRSKFTIVKYFEKFIRPLSTNLLQLLLISEDINILFQQLDNKYLV